MAGVASMFDPKSLEQRQYHIERAKTLKNKGNELYRKLLDECKKQVDQRDKSIVEKSLKEAKRSYHMARLEAQAAYPFNATSFKKDTTAEGPSNSAPDESIALYEEWRDLVASVYNNLAAVILAYPEGHKKEDYERAAEYCSNALLIQKENSKAMYRKAQALEKAGHLRRALSCYRDADLAEKHQNAAIQRDLLRLQAQIAGAKKESKAELKDNIQRGLSKGGLGLSTDATVYGKKKDRKKKRVTKEHSESPSRGSSPSSSSSSDSKSSSSGRSSDEE